MKLKIDYWFSGSHKVFYWMYTVLVTMIVSTL